MADTVRPRGRPVQWVDAKGRDHEVPTWRTCSRAASLPGVCRWGGKRCAWSGIRSHGMSPNFVSRKPLIKKRLVFEVASQVISPGVASPPALQDPSQRERLKIRASNCAAIPCETQLPCSYPASITVISGPHNPLHYNCPPLRVRFDVAASSSFVSAAAA
jgi:hypothetical protein